MIDVLPAEKGSITFQNALDLLDGFDKSEKVSVYYRGDSIYLSPEQAKDFLFKEFWHPDCFYREAEYHSNCSRQGRNMIFEHSISVRAGEIMGIIGNNVIADAPSKEAHLKLTRKYKLLLIDYFGEILPF